MGRKERQYVREVEVGGVVYAYTLVFSLNRLKSASIALLPNGEFVLRTPPFYSLRALDDFAASSIPKLLKRKKKKELPSPYQDGYLYLFGKRVLFPEYPMLKKKDREAFLEEKLEGYLKERFPYWMGVVRNEGPLAYEIKDLQSAYGIFHPKTRKVTFASCLAHYSPEIVDSVIAHELVHDFVHAHDAAFYGRLLKAFPSYMECRKALIHHDYEGTHRLKK